MNKALFGLVCSGGGAVGAYQVGALKYIHEHFSFNGQSPFQVFAGISCGSLNSGFFAFNSHEAQKASLRLEDLWKRFHVPSYSDQLLRIWLRAAARGSFRRIKGMKGNWSLLNPDPMRNIVKSGLQREDLEKAFSQGTTKGVAIAATEVISGYPVWFVEGQNAVPWDRFHSLSRLATIDSKHIIASCSIPIFFPMAQIDDHYFVDGNVNLNRPYSAAISMGATKILSIRTSTPTEHKLPQYKAKFKPSIRTQIRLLFKSFVRDFSPIENEQIEVLNRFAAALPNEEEKVGLSNEMQNAVFAKSFQPSEYQPIHVEVLEPSVDPEEICDELGKKKKRLEGRPHGFLFHRDYIEHLISFGYEDAKRKHDKLAEFFAS